MVQEDGKLKVVALGLTLEDELSRAFDPRPPAASERPSSIQPGFLRRVLDGLRRIAGEQIAVASPVVLCGSPARFHLRRLIKPHIPRIVVLSPAEIPPAISVQSLGLVQ